MNIKICGVTNEDDLKMLIDQGIKYVGFIVTKKDLPWALSAEETSKLLKKIPNSVKSVLGMSHYSTTEMVEIIKVVQPDIVQLQSCENTDQIIEIRRLFPDLIIWKAVFTREKPNIKEILEFEQLIDNVLIHSKEEEWDEGVEIAKNLKKPFILAGGLNAKNIRKAKERFGPWMIDLISGAESVLGKKDSNKVIKLTSLIRDLIITHSHTAQYDSEVVDDITL